MTSRLDSLREALAVSPQNIPLLILFGQACLDELSFEEGRAAFDRILQSDPTHGEAKLGIARVLYLNGNTSEAVVRAEALTKTNPGFGEAWMLLSRLAVAEGDRDLAGQYYQKAVKLSPSLTDPAIEREIQIGQAGTPADSPAAPGPEVELESWELVGEFETESNNSPDIQKLEVSFSNVGGMEEIKEEIRMKIIYQLG